MSKVKVRDEPADQPTEHYRHLIRQNEHFSRALTVALNCGTETAAGMTATVRTRSRIGVSRSAGDAKTPPG